VWFLIIGLVCTAALFLALPCLPSSALGYVVCVIYLVVSVTIDLSIAVQKTSQAGAASHKSAYSFNPKCAVFLTEFIKLVVSLGLAGLNSLKDGKRPDVHLDDAAWLLLPAMLYPANNVLV